MGVCHLILITKTLDKLWLSIMLKGTTPPPSPVIFMASLPSYQKTYLLCTISLEYSIAVKKSQISQYFKMSPKIVTLIACISDIQL